MTFSVFWVRVIAKNPILTQEEETRVSVRVGMMKRLLEQSYQQGVADATEAAKSAKSAPSIFETIFGKGK